MIIILGFIGAYPDANDFTLTPLLYHLYKRNHVHLVIWYLERFPGIQGLLDCSNLIAALSALTFDNDPYPILQASLVHSSTEKTYKDQFILYALQRIVSSDHILTETHYRTFETLLLNHCDNVYDDLLCLELTIGIMANYASQNPIHKKILRLFLQHSKLVQFNGYEDSQNDALCGFVHLLACTVEPDLPGTHVARKSFFKHLFHLMIGWGYRVEKNCSHIKSSVDELTKKVFQLQPMYDFIIDLVMKLCD